MLNSKAKSNITRVIGIFLLAIAFLYLFSSPKNQIQKPTEYLIVPGHSVGMVSLGQSKNAAQRFESDELHLVYKDDKVSEIHFFNKSHRTQQGVGIDSPHGSFVGYEFAKLIRSAENSDRKLTDERYISTIGGLAFYKYDIENIAPLERKIFASGVVFEGLIPSQDLDKKWILGPL